MGLRESSQERFRGFEPNWEKLQFTETEMIVDGAGWRGRTGCSVLHMLSLRCLLDIQVEAQGIQVDESRKHTGDTKGHETLDHRGSE